MNDYTVGDIQARPYPIVPHLPEHPDTIAWPMGDLIADTIPSGIDLQQLNMAMEQAFVDTIPYKGTFAVMVTYKGQPVAERYAEGFGPENRFLIWSMAKSFTNALTGIMVKEGKLELDAPADIEEWQQDERRQITIRHLMQMNNAWNGMKITGTAPT